ncbi:MAG: DUF1015 domain-containing protein [Acidobacteriota bacterium]|nr:DUF1015 domain-containing protein [Acidobacteriota bacterium]
MAEIIPFRALHYDPRKISDLGLVVTQPYDKISPEMQARYYSLSHYNLVRIIRGRTLAEDGPADNVYVRAARDFHAWIKSGVLVSGHEPAIYPYHQEYEVPGQQGVRKVRRGFIALLRLEDYSARVVHRHEETLSGPKADRLQLLKSAGAHYGQIFMLYSDPGGAVENLLTAPTAERHWEQVTDEYGTRHTAWRTADPKIVAGVTAAMSDKRLVIADGHHRYETALAYRNYCREAGRQDGRAEYVMATFVRMETEGLTILPTHRLVRGLASFDWAKFARDARAIFDWEDVVVKGSANEWAAQFPAKLAAAGRERPAMAAYAGPGKLGLLRLRPDFDLDGALADVAPTLRRLDVVLLHRLVLERLLGISGQAVREEKNLSYFRETALACENVEKGSGQVAFLLNPTPVAAVHDNALIDCPMPQKSTDFYPKLLSGLTIYWLDNPAGQ